jgi:maltose alpha-D-glucosyltransferase/alpha-amylase
MAAAKAAAPLVFAASPPAEMADQSADDAIQGVPPRAGLFELAGRDPPALARETIGGYLHASELLGAKTAEMHLALASLTDNPDFAPLDFTRLYQRSLYQSMRSQARTTLALLRAQQRRLDGSASEAAVEVIEKEAQILSRFSRLLQMRIDAQRIRCHGDLHLGQTLFTGKDFVVIDFEGEPERPVSERRIKASPLRDVAGMIRSLHYVSQAAILGDSPNVLADRAAPYSAHQWADFWYAWSSAAYLQAYLQATAGAQFLPADRQQLQTLLESYLLEKALYELRYELNNRPDWVRIPLEGVLHLLT